MLTAEFTQAVETLIQDASLSDDALHTRAHQSLEALQVAHPSESNPARLPANGPPWARRIQKAIPQYPAFSTLHLLRALYFVAEELGLVAGKRYVSASICVYAERAAPINFEGQSTVETNLRLVEALDDLASIWAAFVLWPFYSHGVDDGLNPRRDRHWKFWQGPTLGEPHPSSEEMTPERRAARVQQRRWKAEVMARDDYRCFMSGYPDTDWFFREHPTLAQGAEGEDEDLEFDDCDVVPIIKREALLELPDTDQEITHSILERYFGLDAQTVLEKAEGPQNTLFVNISACVGFREFRLCLQPTETADRYKIVRYAPRNYLGARHVASHVAFADHSAIASRGCVPPSPSPHPSPYPSSRYRPSPSLSPRPSHPRAQTDSPAQNGTSAGSGHQHGVDLPSRALLRMHAALAGVLWRSGAVSAFDCLLRRPHWLPRAGNSWPAPSGSGFWASVVEYMGEETCLEVELALGLSVETLRVRESVRP